MIDLHTGTATRRPDTTLPALCRDLAEYYNEHRDELAQKLIAVPVQRNAALKSWRERVNGVRERLRRYPEELDWESIATVAKLLLAEDSMELRAGLITLIYAMYEKPTGINGERGIEEGRIINEAFRSIRRPRDLEVVVVSEESSPPPQQVAKTIKEEGGEYHGIPFLVLCQNFQTLCETIMVRPLARYPEPEDIERHLSDIVSAARKSPSNIVEKVSRF